jgi:CRISPR-associated protein Cmr2
VNDKIYFSLGPVQGFVAQSRRTRDLWSGSFLLSYLSGCAINEVIAKGGKIEIPDVNGDALLAWIKGSREDGIAPIIGSIPNRFEASVDINPKDVARSAANVVKRKWEDIAEAVWNKFVADAAEEGKGTKEIWDRQVKNFWEISWVVGQDISAMDSRKNWRISSHLDDEPGDHCTMMGDWQELSGFIRSNRKERIKQKAFWSRLSQPRPKMGRFDIGDGERLCALALIKRLFPKVSEKAIGWEVEAKNWPSTPYVAAIPWLERVIDIAFKEANDFAGQVKDAAEDAERKGISRQIGSFSTRTEPFLNLDGNFYFEKALIDCKRTPLDGTPTYLKKCEEEPEDAKEIRKKLRIQLSRIAEKTGSRPRSFYAMLLMDGDNMGKLMVDHESKSISKALSIFTKDVRNIVQEHNGVTIYAGGDDVLAMLPLTRAFGCALSLSQKYEASFEKVVPEATISAGLVFSHYHIPLSSVMREAHHILDNVAKDQNGRGSIAVSVLKTSGKYCQWTATWDRLMDENDKMRIDDLVLKVHDGPQKQFSKSFFYGMRDDLAILSGDQILKPGSYAKLVIDLEPLPLLAAEYMKSRERTVSRKEAEERVRTLLELSYRSRKSIGPETNVLSPDAAMLIKFLSQTTDGGME